jgi:hypothetical protein
MVLVISVNSYLRSVSNNGGSSKLEWTISRSEPEERVLEHLLARISQTSESCKVIVPGVLKPNLEIFSRVWT